MEVTASVDSTVIVPAVNSPAYQWITMSDNLPLIALVVGIVIFVISWFSGGRDNKNKLLVSILFASIIGFFSVPLFIKAWTWLGVLDSTIGVISLQTFLMVYVAALAANFYEIITVTAREARPPD